MTRSQTFYRAVQAVAHGRLEWTEKPLIDPPPGHVRILAKKLGAHHYVDSTATDPAAALQALGGAALIIATASGGKAVAQTIGGLKPRGRIIVLGASSDPIELATTDLLFARRGIDGPLTGAGRSIEGSVTGDPATGDETLKFSLLSGVAAMVEVSPLERAAEGYARMMSGNARFRVVLTMQPASTSR
jgi:propanol-preferring alcohol dehydrogenase